MLDETWQPRTLRSSIVGRLLLLSRLLLLLLLLLCGQVQGIKYFILCLRVSILSSRFRLRKATAQVCGVLLRTGVFSPTENHNSMTIIAITIAQHANFQHKPVTGTKSELENGFNNFGNPGARRLAPWILTFIKGCEHGLPAERRDIPLKLKFITHIHRDKEAVEPFRIGHALLLRMPEGIVIP
jgi:hypothetical protein